MFVKQHQSSPSSKITENSNKPARIGRVPKMMFDPLKAFVFGRSSSRRKHSERNLETRRMARGRRKTAETIQSLGIQDEISEPLLPQSKIDQAEEQEPELLPRFRGSVKRLGAVIAGLPELPPAQINQAQEELEEARKELALLHGHCQFVEKRNQTLERDLCHLERKLHETEESLHAATADIRTAQTAVFQQKKLRSPDDDSQDVRSALTRFHTKVRAWAKEYGVTFLNGCQEVLRERQQEFIEELQDVADFPDWESLESLRHPFLVLAAVLAKHLHVWIFSNPFFIFSGPEASVTSSLYAESLHDTFHKFWSVNPAGAHNFRTQLLRAAFPNSTLRKDTPSSPLILESATTALYSEILSDFLNSTAASVLLKPGNREAEDCQAELFNIVCEAARIAIHLATQRKFYVWDSPEHVLGQRFGAGSEYYKADKLNRVEDEEDNKCDGMPIRLLLSHAVRAFGDNDGQDYSESLLVAKAVVWVDDREEETEEEEW
ncbi:hypothetical protein IWZ00DRAFT_488673 [Phyllosticta capitalensis]